MGGAERAVYQIVREETALGEWEVAVAFGCAEGPYFEALSAMGCEVVDLGLRSGADLRRARATADALSLFDLHHFHSLEPSQLLASARCERVTRVFTQRHGVSVAPVPLSKKMRRSLGGYLLRRHCHAVAGNTRHAAAEAVRAYRLEHLPCEVTYNGLDFSLLMPARDRTAMRRELGVGETSVLVGSSGTLKIWKRFERLIDLLPADPRLQTVLVGDGGCRPALEARARELGVTDRLRITGLVGDVADYLQAMDIFVLPLHGRRVVWQLGRWWRPSPPACPAWSSPTAPASVSTIEPRGHGLHCARPGRPRGHGGPSRLRPHSESEGRSAGRPLRAFRLYPRQHALRVSQALPAGVCVQRGQTRAMKAAARARHDFNLPDRGNVAVVTNIPRPYRRALFEVLKQQLSAEGLRLRVLYTSDPTKHARRGSPAAVVADAEVERYVPGLTLQTSYDRVLSVPTGLVRALDDLAPACVICGGFGADALMVKRWCHSNGVPRVVWSGVWPGRTSGPGRLTTARRRWVAKGAAAYVASEQPPLSTWSRSGHAPKTSSTAGTR